MDEQMTDAEHQTETEIADRREEVEPTSILGQLRDRREEIRSRELLTLPVPRWNDPEVLVRYRPLEHSVIRKAQQQVEKAPKAQRYEREVDANCDILIRGCEAVFARVEGQDYSLRPDDPKGEPTTFDEDLAANLGLADGATARQVVKALFFTDGDIMSQSQTLVEWSGYRETEADEALSGE